jgi:hypothetical protein
MAREAKRLPEAYIDLLFAANNNAENTVNERTAIRCAAVASGFSLGDAAVSTLFIYDEGDGWR